MWRHAPGLWTQIYVRTMITLAWTWCGLSLPFTKPRLGRSEDTAAEIVDFDYYAVVIFDTDEWRIANLPRHFIGSLINLSQNLAQSYPIAIFVFYCEISVASRRTERMLPWYSDFDQRCSFLDQHQTLFSHATDSVLHLQYMPSLYKFEKLSEVTKIKFAILDHHPIPQQIPRLPLLLNCYLWPVQIIKLILHVASVDHAVIPRPIIWKLGFPCSNCQHLSHFSQPIRKQF